MAHIELKVKCYVSFSSMKQMILTLLYERGKDFTWSRKNILSNLHLTLRLHGENYLTTEQPRINYENKTGYQGMLDKAERLTYKYFPELSEEENTVKFIKQLGD